MPIKIKPLLKDGGQISIDGKKRRKHEFMDTNGNRLPNDVPLAPPERHHSKKMTIQTRKNIVEMIRLGNFPDVAAESCGVSYETMKDWLSLGSPSFISSVKDRTPYKRYIRFYRNVMQALAESESKLLNQIHKAANQDWRAAAWMLERRSPKRWGKKTLIQKRTRKSVRLKKEITKRILNNSEATEKAIEVFETIAETTDDSN